MISPEFFFNLFIEKGTDFFAGVPDSSLKYLCTYINDHVKENNHIICANEGNAVALATGYHLVTGKIAATYMQNSGLGNIINPLLSIVDKDVYSIPLLLIIGFGQVGPFVSSAKLCSCSESIIIQVIGGVDKCC